MGSPPYSCGDNGGCCNMASIFVDLRQKKEPYGSGSFRIEA